MYTVIAAGTITRVGLGLLLVRTLLYLAQDTFQESMEKVRIRRCIIIWLHISYQHKMQTPLFDVNWYYISYDC